MQQFIAAEKRESDRPIPANPHLRNAIGRQGKSLSPSDSNPRPLYSSLLPPLRRSAPTLMRTPASRLAINHPNDAFEQEADRVADQVMRMTDPTANATPQFSDAGVGMQRKCTECEKEDDDQRKLQRKEAGAGP